MNQIFTWALARLSEPSTWASISALVGSMTFLTNATADAKMVGLLGTAISGVIGIIMKEKSGAK